MNPNDAFVSALRRATLKWRTRFDAELKRSGQTLGRARALMALSREPGGMMQRDLAAELSIEHPTLVRILDGLERRRLIAREPVPEDKRANRISLTVAAEPVVAQVNNLFKSLQEDVLRSIPPEDLATATRVLEAVVEKLDTVAMAGDAPLSPTPGDPARDENA